MKKEEIFEYVQKQYGTMPEYLWSKLSDSAVLRHKNGKWYAVIMTVEKSKLGLEGNDLVDIMDVKCDPEMTSMIIQTYGFLPALFVKLDVSKTLFFCCYISSCFDRGYLDQSKLSMTSGSDHRCAIIDSLACSRCWAVKQV